MIRYSFASSFLCFAELYSALVVSESAACSSSSLSAQRVRSLEREREREIGKALSKKAMTRPRLVIVKLGGAAITDKSREETLCSKGLAAAAAAVGAAFRENSPSGTRFIVVHGAGSFGHQAAAREGFSSPISPDSNAGDPRRSAAAVARVRASCGRLHSAVVSSLVAAGVPALSHPPAPAGWCSAAHGKEVVDHSCGLLAGLLDAGACPVLHGDVVSDDDAPGGFAVLSGDLILSTLAEQLGGGLLSSTSSSSSSPSGSSSSSSSVAVFITDVDGVFSRPPTASEAPFLPPLLRRLRPRRPSDGGGGGEGGGVGGDLVRCSDSDEEEGGGEGGEGGGGGASESAAGAAPLFSAGPSGASADVTGGMGAKLRAAAAAARAGTTVLVVRVGSRSAAAALVLGAAAPERFKGWRGTVISAPQATRRTTG